MINFTAIFKKHNMEKIDSIDGLDFLMDNFFEDEIILDKLFKYIYFIDVDLVIEQANKVLDEIERGNPIPVRYSQKDGAYFKNNVIRKSSPKFKNRKEAYNVLKNEVYFSSTKDRSKIRVCIDSDGNKSIKDFISKRTYHAFTNGKSTIINSMISHIWGNTNDPLFFSLLWNIVITPLPISFILDKQEDTIYSTTVNEKNRKFIKEFKNIIKAVSILLYEPNKLMRKELLEKYPDDDVMIRAKDLIDGNKIKFLPYHTSRTNV